MNRKLLSLLVVGLLPACAPSQSSAATDPGNAALSLEQGRVTFSAGQQSASQVTLTVSGSLRAADLQPCLPQLGQLICTLGTVPGGETKTLIFGNVQSAQATYQRPDGKTYNLFAP